jgi:signal transduction histidine kinase
VHLTVTDNGPGLGRVAARTSLGLTTTRAMVAACSGSFELYAGPDGGAVADICLAQAELRSVAS